MGADFISAMIPIPGDTDHIELKETLLSMVDKLDEDTLNKFNVLNSEHEYPDDDPDYEELRSIMKEYIELGFNAMDSRLSDYIVFNDVILHIAGGLSWGDSPSKAYDDLRNLTHVFATFDWYGTAWKDIA